MTHPESRRVVAILVAFIASIGSSARAGFETFTVSTPANKVTDFSTTLAVPSFNAALGTLESVVLSIADEANFQGTVTNNSASSRVFNISETTSFSASLFGSTVLTDNLAQAKNGNMIGSGQSVAFGVYSLAGSSGPTAIIDPTMLAKFTGTSPLGFGFATQSIITVGGGGGNTSNIFHTTADSTLTVTYNYISANVTPEPASLVMTTMGGLLAAAGYARSRRRPSR